jgi:hypothetical protein
MRKNIILTVVLVIALSIATGGENGASGGAEGKTAAGGENSLSFSSEKISGDGFTVSYVEAVKHNMQTSGKKYIAMIIQLANYDRGGKSWLPNPKEDGQRRVMVNFSAPSGEELKVGQYKVAGKMAKDFCLSIGIEGKSDGKVKSIGLSNGVGSGEITFIDDKIISGNIDVKDSKGTQLKATFTTPYTKSRY